jgi:transposase
MNFAGIDTGYKIWDGVVRKKGKSLRCRSFSNTPSGHSERLSYLRKHKVKRVGIEATGYYHLDVATELDDAPRH